MSEHDKHSFAVGDTLKLDAAAARVRAEAEAAYMLLPSGTASVPSGAASVPSGTA